VASEEFSESFDLFGEVVGEWCCHEACKPSEASAQLELLGMGCLRHFVVDRRRTM